MLGLSNPYALEVKNFLGYDITKLQDSQRFFEVMLARFGAMNAIKALYFDGAVSYFNELPKPDNTEFLEKIYRYIRSLTVYQTPQKEESHVFITWSKIVNKLRGKDKEI